MNCIDPNLQIQVVTLSLGWLVNPAGTGSAVQAVRRAAWAVRRAVRVVRRAIRAVRRAVQAVRRAVKMAV